MLDKIERNLLLFLDPVGEIAESSWRFVRWQNLSRGQFCLPTKNETFEETVHCFHRSAVVWYLLFSWSINRRAPRSTKIILYMNDGLLSSIFNADKAEGYRAFSSCHIPPPTTLRQKLTSLLPLSLRAEKRYVIIGKNITSGEALTRDDAILCAQDFMFFSNANGKLLLTSAETLRSGKGLVLKTTSYPPYREVLEKEFTTMLEIAGRQGKTSALPFIGKRVLAGKRVFYSESYVNGKSLRDVLHTHSRRNNIFEIRACLDDLNEWFEKYQAAFRDGLKPLSSCYSHLFKAFSKLYGGHPEASRILEMAHKVVVTIARTRVGVAPITAHNDLWPGNFIVGTEGLIAIDWERAVGNRAPLFDYYWMIISAALEPLVCRIGSVDYSRAFRLFLKQADDISQYAADKLKSFLVRLGIDKELHQDFLLLFLMEWSVQGYLALGQQTSMDMLAFGELVMFI